MSIIRYRPVREGARVAPWDQVDRLFNGLLSDVWSDAPARAAEPTLFAPAVDITQEADGVVLRAELPGVKREDVEITVHENTLTLKGTKRAEATGGDEKKGYRYVERTYGEFLRTFPLPAAVDATKVRAEFKDGVLEIRMPITEEAKPRKIEINGN